MGCQTIGDEQMANIHCFDQNSLNNLAFANGYTPQQKI
jgi:hypothetical protein